MGLIMYQLKNKTQIMQITQATKNYYNHFK